MLAATRRCQAVFFGAWLFMVPQIMFSSTVPAFCDEYGTASAPQVEEEEVEHLGMAPSTFTLHQPCRDHDVEALPNWVVILVHVPHGDVPHLPPWIAYPATCPEQP